MPAMGQKHQKVNTDAETSAEAYQLPKLNTREERFSVTFATSDDKNRAFDIGGYKASNSNSRNAAICRLLRTRKIKARIEEIRDEIAMANGVTVSRITAKLAKIAFSDKGNEANQIKCLELLGKDRKMFSDNVNYTDTTKMAELSERERAEILALAAIRLGAEIIDITPEPPLLPDVQRCELAVETTVIQGNKDDVQGQGEAEGSEQIGSSEVSQA